MKNKEFALIIMAKAPVMGQVKTRLAASIGDVRALKVYQRLLELNLDVAHSCGAEVRIFFAQESDYTRDFKTFYSTIQKGKSLGDKMKDAFIKTKAAGFEKMVMIGSDCPDISTAIIDQAFKALDANDLVLGPGEDGGYYLIGMKKVNNCAFDDLPWSQPDLFKQTTRALQMNGLTFVALQKLNDIDNLEDLKNSSLFSEFEEMTKMKQQ